MENASVGSMLFDGTHLATSVSEEQPSAVKRELGLRRAATFRERSPCPQKHIELLNFWQPVLYRMVLVALLLTMMI